MKKTLSRLASVALLIFSLVLLTACSQQGWTLTSGTPPYADPDPLVYEGNVELTGWVVYQPAYVGEDVPHFYVVNREDLPEPVMDKNFQIAAPESIEKELLNSSEENPITVKATKIQVHMEGSPMMTIE